MAGWVLLAAAIVVLSFALVGQRAGDLGFDDAYYFKQGIAHAHRVEARPASLARLGWSLTFEPQRPPLYLGWIGAGTLWLGDENLPRLFRWALWGPLAALILAVSVAGHRAQGWGAAAAATATLLAAPAVLELAARPMTDLTLAATVAWVLVALAWRLERGGVGPELAVGFAVGLAMLAKLTAALFVMPMALVAAVVIHRREGTKPAFLFAVRSALVALVVIAPWYLRHVAEALDYARYAASFWPCADTGNGWTRPLRLVGATVGWPLFAGALAAAVLGRPAERSVGGAVPWGILAAAATVPAAIVVMIPPVFEPRYLLAAFGPLAVAVGLGLWRAIRCGGPPTRVAAFALAAVLFAVGAARARERPVVPTAWGSSALLSELARGAENPVRVCVLGNRPDWNVDKLRLVAERERLTSRLEIRDWLHQRAARCPDGMETSCDAIVALDPAGVPDDESQRRLNEGLAECLEKVRSLGPLYETCERCAQLLDSPAPVEVLRKARTSGPEVRP